MKKTQRDKVRLGAFKESDYIKLKIASGTGLVENPFPNHLKI